MTNFLNNDSVSGLAEIDPATSLLSSEHELTAGIRVTRAQFAKMMGCSRQAVTDWVSSGRLIVGSDGRFDPCKAVADLLRTGDPARLRAKVLRPLVDELATYRRKITEMEGLIAKMRLEHHALSLENQELQEDCSFYEGSANGFCELFNALTRQLPEHWSYLAALPPEEGLRIVMEWLNNSLMSNDSHVGPMVIPKKFDDDSGDESAPDSFDVFAELERLNEIGH